MHNKLMIHKRRGCMLYIFFLFCIVFSFPIPLLGMVSSQIFFVGALIYYFLSPCYRFFVNQIIRTKRLLFIFFFLTLLIIYCALLSTVFSTYDYTIIRVFLRHFFILLDGVLLFAFYAKSGNVESVPRHIICIFLIQSFIILASMISPDIRLFLDYFKSPSIVEKASRSYDGFRGLAISSGGFFSLASAFGLIFIYYFDLWNDMFKKAIILRFLFVFPLLIAALSAGRASLAGLFLGIIHFLCSSFLKFLSTAKVRIKKRRPQNIFIHFIIVILLFIFPFVFNNPSQYSIDAFERFNKYAFQFIYNYQSTGRFSSSSTDALFERMYFPLDASTLLIGDVFYTDPDGGYYKSTDAGYMRNFLYFGTIGFMLLFIYQLFFFYWIRKNLRLNLIIITYILIIHIKGDVLGYGSLLQVILFLLLLSNLWRGRNFPADFYTQI